MTDQAPERRESWWRKQITMGNLLAIAAILAGLIAAQTRAEMTATELAKRVGTVEARLDKGEFMRTDVANEKLDRIRDQIGDLKESITSGFARLERAVR